jgi:nucleoside triphosphate pyrophosphatase
VGVRLILASASPARRQLLTEAGHDFEVRPAGIDEPSGAGFTDPRAYVEHVGWQKAHAVASTAARSDASIVISADTVGWIDGQPVGKPADEADARRILERLAGTAHELWTGVCLWRRPDDLQIAFQEKSIVAMRALSPVELDAYLKTRKWQGCSGAYAIEIGDDPYVRVVSGSKTNVIGLPMEKLQQVLTELKVEP